MPPEVPEEFARDYREACLILADSPNASAALSRRCLQHILREKQGMAKPNLYQEIEEVVGSNTLPSHITDDLHKLREMGNLAAHPMKDSNTSLIVPVTPEEAEWCLDIIEALYDFYFVMPARSVERRQRLSQKMGEVER